MLCASLDHVAQEVLSSYTLPPHCCQTIGSAGGFSGAHLWRVRTSSGDFCLKAWPNPAMTPERMGQIHVWMKTAAAADLSFVPEVIHGAGGATWRLAGDRVWDLTSWMPGRADQSPEPAKTRVDAACEALSQLHTSWRGTQDTAASPPSVIRRARAATEWATLLRDNWRPDFTRPGLEGFSSVATQAWELLRRLLPNATADLAPWLGKSFALQPCLCDIWRDHVLFTGDAVSGIIDYGAMRLDHRAADLARLLGSLAGDHAGLFSSGLAAYRRRAHLSDEEELLVRMLDRTGMVLAAGTWLGWLYRDGRQFPDRAAALRRFSEVTFRIAAWMKP